MSETEEKKHDASERKLDKKREEGSVPQTSDSSSMFGAAGAIIAILATSLVAWDTFKSFLVSIPDIFLLPFDEALKVGVSVIFDVLSAVIFPVWFATLFVSVGLTLIMNKGVVFSMKPVTPDIKRISPVEGFKRIFGKRGQIEILVSFFRLVLWIVFAAIVGTLWLPSVFSSVECDGLCLYLNISPAFEWLGFGSIVLLVVFASVSLVMQRKIFMHEQRMTDTERKNERKDQNGSPQVAQERNRIRNALSVSGGGKKVTVEETSIVISSPTGMVGIVFCPPEHNVPLVTTKKREVDEAKAMVLQLAKLGIPIVEDPELFEGCKKCFVGEMIPATTFKLFARAVGAANARAQMN